MRYFGNKAGTRRPYAALLLLLVAMVVVAAGSPARAQQDHPTGPMSSRERPETLGPTDEREVEAFLDGYVGHQLEDYDIPGATVSVVRDGRVLFAKGYGQADVKHEKAVSADGTLFRIASISKLFAATSVMQLAEASCCSRSLRGRSGP